MAQMTPQEMADDIARLLHVRYGVGRVDLATSVRRSKRYLPYKIRSAIRVLIDAVAQASVPKLARQVDMKPTEQAHRTCVSYLNKVGAAERRKDFVLRLAASVVLAMIIIAALAIMASR